MSMTVIVTRDVSMRTRGFLASIVPEQRPESTPRLHGGIDTQNWEDFRDQECGHRNGQETIDRYKECSAGL